MTAPQHITSSRASSWFLIRWAVLASGSALVLSAIDAALLQRRSSFFTGGFLSVDHLVGRWDVTAFLALSLLSDMAVVGVPAAATLWICCRLRIGTALSLVTSVLAACVPLLIANVISYELMHYLGDALDVSLIWDLTGGSISEIAAVASPQLAIPGLLIVAAGAAAVALFWGVRRYAAGAPTSRASGRVLLLPSFVAVLALGATTWASASSNTLENGLRRKPSGKVLSFVANKLSDVDRDGFGVAARLTDPDPFDSSVFPYALDIPGNGVDENGIGGDLPSSVPPYLEAPVSSELWRHRPDVVLVVLESFRADIVGAQHGGRPITPMLDALGARGIASQHAYSHNGYTTQSRYHIFSGSLAGLRDDRTLIDDFKANGYRVGYFSGQDESFGGAAFGVGFDRAHVAFDARADRERRYSTFTTAGSLAIPSAVVQERIDAFLRDGDGDPRPLLLYVNFHDTHFPYWHEGVETLVSPARLPRHRITPEERAALTATYVNTAANVDRAVAQVIAAVARVRGAEPGVIVTADHGESLFEDGFLGHGHALNDIQTRIPLIVANLPVVIEEPFGQIQLRDALSRALRTDPAMVAVPRLRRTPDHELFQYLGNIDRPRQIAFLRAGGRTIYDFRNRRAQLPGRPWQRLEALVEAERATLLRLIHYWERIALARRVARHRDGDD